LLAGGDESYDGPQWHKDFFLTDCSSSASVVEFIQNKKKTVDVFISVP
jgi:hypothetical protein